MSVKYFLFVVLIFGSAWAQSELSLSTVNVTLPPELQGKVDEKEIQNIQNKSVEVFKEKCIKNGGLNAFTNAEKSFNGLTECLGMLVNTSVLQQEIEDAKPNGQVDEVFKKYCGKKTQFKGCFSNVIDSVKPCFAPEEHKNLNTAYNVSEQLAEFICYKDGDRIALFIAEGGPDCFQDKQEQIQECVNTIFGTEYRVDPKNLTADSIPTIDFGEKECGKMTELQTCVVAVLEKCAQPTSANIVESLFKFVRKATPCREFQNPDKDPRGAASGLTASLTAVIAVTVTLLY